MIRSLSYVPLSSLFLGAKTESSLDNFFISSRTSKAPQSFDSQTVSDPESEANSLEKRKDEIAEEKPKKCA